MGWHDSVGYVHTDSSAREDLAAAARKHREQHRLDLAIAYDPHRIFGTSWGQHAVIATAEGGLLDVVGNLEDVARTTAAFIDKRQYAFWYRTEHTSTTPYINEYEGKRFAETLQFAQETGLLHDPSGNLSMSIGEDMDGMHEMLITPRKLDKSRITIDDICKVRVDHDQQKVSCEGPHKSSIDTPIHDKLYAEREGIGYRPEYQLHFHDGWGSASTATTFPYPCGTVQEGLEVLKAVQRVPPRQDHLIELVNHGFLLCLSEDGIKRLRSEWTASVDAYVKHLADVKREDALSQGRLKPIFNDARIAGVVLEMPDGVAVHLNESARGLGLGKTIVQQAYWRQTPIRTISACGVVKYYEEHNFRPEKRPDGDYILHPPLIHDTSPVLKYLAAQGL